MRLQPPLRAICLLFLTSDNFSPFGPMVSQTEYFGGGDSKLLRGGSPRFHRRWKGRWCARGGIRGPGAASSSIMERRTLGEWAELARLRLEPLVEWRGSDGLAKSWEAMKLGGILSLLLYFQVLLDVVVQELQIMSMEDPGLEEIPRPGGGGNVEEKSLRRQ